MLTVGRVNASVARAYFLRNGAEDRECPSDVPRCRQRSYLVQGDRVVVSRALGPFVCADFLDARHIPHSGWLLASAVTPAATPPPALGDWIGNWMGVESSIAVKPGARPGALWFSGEATWGASDPERVKRGAIHIGSFDATATPRVSEVSFTVGEESTLPIDRGSESDCKVWMRLLGPYLLVSDNMNCGGMNVSFDGLYWRSAAPIRASPGFAHAEPTVAAVKARSGEPAARSASELQERVSSSPPSRPNAQSNLAEAPRPISDALAEVIAMYGNGQMGPFASDHVMREHFTAAFISVWKHALARSDITIIDAVRSPAKG